MQSRSTSLTSTWFAAAFGILSLASPGLAQRAWVVDLAGGPGVDFRQIQPAINAASPGDRIEVRGSGAYAGFTLGKGLHIEGIAGAGVASSLVTSVPVNQWVRIVGLAFDAFQPPFQRGPLAVEGCAGPVTLAACTFRSMGDLGPLQLVDCASVLMLDCVSTFGGAPWYHSYTHGIYVVRSRLVLQRCSFTGGNPVYSSQGPAAQGGAGLYATSSQILAVRSVFQGGRSDVTYPCFLPNLGGPAVATDGAALFMDGCTLHGGPASIWCPPSSQGWSVNASGPAVHVTTDCTLNGATRNMASLPPQPAITSPGLAVRGAPVTLVLSARPGSLGLLWFDGIHGFEPIPGIEVPVLLSLSPISLPTISVGNQGAVPLTFSVPTDPALAWRFVFFQGLVLEPQDPTPHLTNLGDLHIR